MSAGTLLSFRLGKLRVRRLCAYTSTFSPDLKLVEAEGDEKTYSHSSASSFWTSKATAL